MSKIVTLNNFILERQKDFPFATGELTNLLSDIAFAAKIVNRDVNRAGLVDILGAKGETNVQGEEQQKLDVIADDAFIRAFKTGEEVCGIASEENDDFVAFDDEISKDGKYVVLFDPLDGSSNIDVNVSIGTIFSIYRRISKPGTPAVSEDFLQKGTEQIAAGYVLFGSSTMLVYTTGKGVNGFTLDPSIGEFCLSHPQMKIGQDPHMYSINEGNYAHFPQGVKDYIKYCQQIDEATNRPFISRYIGSMVADLHRNLLKGGIFLYPATASYPNGKLRLMYECNPLAFIIEQAGGKASNGESRILEIQPESMHERTPVFIGNIEMVEMVEEYLL